MEQQVAPNSKKIYLVILFAIIALLIGAVGLAIGLTNSTQDKTSTDNTMTPNSSGDRAQPGGPPGPRDNPIYSSQGSSDSDGGGGTKKVE